MYFSELVESRKQHSDHHTVSNVIDSILLF